MVEHGIRTEAFRKEIEGLKSKANLFSNEANKIAKLDKKSEREEKILSLSKDLGAKGKEIGSELFEDLHWRAKMFLNLSKMVAEENWEKTLDNLPADERTKQESDGCKSTTMIFAGEDALEKLNISSEHFSALEKKAIAGLKLLFNAWKIRKAMGLVMSHTKENQIVHLEKANDISRRINEGIKMLESLSGQSNILSKALRSHVRSSKAPDIYT